MRRISILLAITLLAISCSSYTIADGRNNISVPEYTNLPATKLEKKIVEIEAAPIQEEEKAEAISQIEANAIFLYLPEENIPETSLNSLLSDLEDIDPDIIVLLGSRYNQNLFASIYDNVYELEGVYIILSGRLQNTDSLELYLDDIYALLAQIEIPVLSSK